MPRLNMILAGWCEHWHSRISPTLPGACRFTPTCSMYAAEAFRRHGVFIGLRLAILRVARCRRGGPSGHHPVP